MTELYPLLEEIRIYLPYWNVAAWEESVNKINAMLWDFDRLIKLNDRNRGGDYLTLKLWNKNVEEFNDILDKWSKVIE